MPSECDCEGSDEILQILIDKGANVNAMDKFAHTALDAALRVNKTEGEFKTNALQLPSPYFYVHFIQHSLVFLFMTSKTAHK